MRKLKKEKEKLKHKEEILELKYDEADELYQAFTYILMQDMFIDLFDFNNKIKKQDIVPEVMKLIESKNKINFDRNPVFNDYNTSEIIKYFSKISDKFTTKEKILDILKRGFCDREFVQFLKK